MQLNAESTSIYLMKRVKWRKKFIMKMLIMVMLTIHWIITYPGDDQGIQMDSDKVDALIYIWRGIYGKRLYAGSSLNGVSAWLAHTGSGNIFNAEPKSLTPNIVLPPISTWECLAYSALYIGLSKDPDELRSLWILGVAGFLAHWLHLCSCGCSSWINRWHSFILLGIHSPECLREY